MAGASSVVRGGGDLSGGALAHRLLTLQVDLVRSMHEPVKDRIGKRGVAEHSREPPNSNE
jgi:hypothetical protein